MAVGSRDKYKNKDNGEIQRFWLHQNDEPKKNRECPTKGMANKSRFPAGMTKRDECDGKRDQG